MTEKSNIFLTTIVLILAALVATSQARGKTVPLYLGAPQSAEIPSLSLALTRAGIEHQVPASGDTIELPKQKKREAQLLLLQSGLPKSVGRLKKIDELTFPAGYSLHDYLVDLEQELNEVLALDSRFGKPGVQLKLRPSAVVTAQVRAKKGLSSAEYQALVNLLLLSVPGLKAENVLLVEKFGQWGSPFHNHSCLSDCLEPRCQMDFGTAGMELE